MRVIEVLEDSGYTREAPDRAPAWTGHFSARDQSSIRVTALPGPDVVARLRDGRLVLGECKGSRAQAARSPARTSCGRFELTGINLHVSTAGRARDRPL